MTTSLSVGVIGGNRSGGSFTHVVAIPLTCIASFFFYQLGNQISSSPGGSGFRLRSNNVVPPANGVDMRADAKIAPIYPHTNILQTTMEMAFDVPACAQDVMLTLHAEGGGERARACQGLLLRDDLIVTSRACSTFKFSFDYPGGRRLRAVPHPSLNAKSAAAESRLGFLEANPPYHYYYSDRPVRRSRMFLSKQPHHRHPGKVVLVACGKRGEPIGYNFPVDTGVVVPLETLKGIVPHDILWHKDIYTARALADKTHRWYVRPTTLEKEEKTLKALFPEWRGPPGSISIPDAHGSFLEKATALMEAIDPRGHRRQDCFMNYYLRYQRERPFSGMKFFDWLDFGRGKHLLEKNMKKSSFRYMTRDEKCLKSDFNRHKVHYFTNEERREHEIYFEPSLGGKQTIARYKQDDRLVPRSEPDSPHLYMWDLAEKFYIVDSTWDKEKYGTIKHTAVVAGKPALSAGKAYFGENGVVWGINFSSGHYRPNIEAASMMYQWMKNQEFNVTSFHWVGRQEWSTKDCALTNWESIKIAGYDPTLEHACREVTASPTWILKEDV